MINLDYFKGDLLKSGALGIAHQVNRQGVMGSGVAAQIKKKWPVVFNNYRYLYDKGYNPALGESREGFVKDGDTSTAVVYNIYSQDNFGRDGKRYTSYDALYDGLEETFKKFNDWAKYAKGEGRQVLAIPRLGCGLGGGSWHIVEAIIETLIAAHTDYEFDLHVYDLP